MTAIAILSPGYPHQPGGVTDHTSRLARHWSEAGHTVLVSSNLGDSAAQVLAGWSAAGVTAALIQYVPFLYGRRGLSRYPERIATAARNQGIRVTVMVHEPWVPPTRLPWLILGPLQQLQLRRLMRKAAATATPVPAWQRIGRTTATLAYVGSTLGDRVTASPAQSDLLDSPVLFSPFAAGLNWEWIVAAVRSLRAPRGLVVLGAAEDEARRHAIAGWIDPGWDWRGRLPPADVLTLLSRARLVLAPFVDGVTGRRTSVCAALSTGSRTISSTGHLFDPFFRQGPLEIASSTGDFAARAVRLWAQPDSPAERAQRITWYDRNLGPRQLDLGLLDVVTGKR